MSGENVVSEVPAVILFSYAHTEALNLNMQSYRAYYDEINVYNPDEKIYPKAAHQSRNRNRVDRSDLVVFYVEHEYGGTWQTMKYAVNQKKKIINLVTK